jgi:hypothetical protein
MTIGIEFERTAVNGKRFIRIAPIITGVNQQAAFHIKAVIAFVVLMSSVVAIGNVLQ